LWLKFLIAEQTGEVKEAKAEVRDRWRNVTVGRGVDGNVWA
jgi:hypothetical protein